ncbi:hypothetical protein FCR2A7T_17510 [Flavobacterium cauense R2A-7]|uniref:Uncharacterized protein n=1 Tax=Flavobacterium cauense R2A-7 TaxID=1341154 RepID=V6RYN2_9FLAO|nr:hypothetical protein [Flavobacterium cauense]ESU19596.1 hypothetical protein FCR2A7T_17510 [Flavobacterium cauense R2A-7]KGO84120.1 hypothetical protein Q762_02500 [Flavobacterium cauense R2A-7]TWI14531.1 hypothetical protein IP98_00488 [Flavobacterium cauense R2A-7]
MQKTLKTNSLHTFHIPVMGLAYTIDSPIRVAQYGISSVISIMDDELIEKMNAFYSKKFDLPYQEISQKISDYRAKRITSYLNTVDKIVTEKFENFKTELSESKAALENYITMLPNKSEIKKGLENFIQEGCIIKENIKNYLEKNLFPGEIDINIMTKVDKDNFDKKEQLPVEFNDAHAALRGFANSTLNSSVVLSAGMNPRLYSYFETFPDFFPNENSELKKKIILKVSDFRSAMIQGNFLAKKGLWVSEYRIESGLNCGGHAFATDGYLLGPILEEFKQKKENLIASAHELLCKALQQKNLPVPETPLELKITVQGGVGTAEEHEFLLDFYKTDSVGWGSPFLLVPEATSSDNDTRELLAKAKEEDLYLSHISPLGIPFNTVKGTTNELLREKRIHENKAGSSCPKKYLALSKQYDEKGICTASRKYQDIKLEELETEKENLSEREYAKKQNAITEKSCLCIGLANASLLENNIKIKGEAQGVVVCPGPNIAYFNRQYSLPEMVQHIYGYKSVLNNVRRPNMFVKELSLYLNYFKKEVQEAFESENVAQQKKLNNFKENLLSGIEYYRTLFASGNYFQKEKEAIQHELNQYKTELETLEIGVLT